MTLKEINEMKHLFFGLTIPPGRNSAFLQARLVFAAASLLTAAPMVHGQP